VIDGDAAMPGRADVRRAWASFGVDAGAQPFRMTTASFSGKLLSSKRLSSKGESERVNGTIAPRWKGA
jgi:predicted NBD/HSP70 family sugar kinase